LGVEKGLESFTEPFEKSIDLLAISSVASKSACHQATVLSKRSSELGGICDSVWGEDEDQHGLGPV
jgi:hypothetical protein